MTSMNIVREITSKLPADHSSIGHVVNIRSLTGDYKFTESLQLREASAIESECLKLMSDFQMQGDPIRRDWPHLKTYVLEAPDGNIEFHELTAATCLTPVRFVLSNQIAKMRLGQGDETTCLCWASSATERFQHDLECNQVEWIDLDNTALDQIRDVRSRWNDAAEVLQRAVSEYQSLDGIPRWSPLRFLGYMMIIESLATHKPDEHDPYSSLTRQVKKKMQLVSKRAKIPFRHDLLQPNVAEDKVWAAIYAHRSNIAHGSGDAITSKTACLKNKETAITFIDWATRTVMRQWLDEPVLMESLQAV